jgi:hypothetical protein
MMTEIIFMIEESLEGGFVARAIGQSIVTEAEMLESLKEMIRDAVKCHFETDQLPRIIRLHFVKEEILAV